MTILSWFILFTVLGVISGIGHIHQLEAYLEMKRERDEVCRPFSKLKQMAFLIREIKRLEKSLHVDQPDCDEILKKIEEHKFFIDKWSQEFKHPLE
tara:strand:+ start:376 stop:663 length:288 start_codon:yes stop_codon:yes gene_type:complete